VSRQLAAVARAQRHKPRSSVPAQRLVLADPLREQQPLDPVAVADSLGDQRLAFAHQPPAIFLFWTRRPDHRADPRLAALVGQERPHQRLAVDAVRLGSFLPPRSRDRGRVDHMAFDPFLLQGAVDPEPIETRLLEDDSPIAVARPRLRLCLQRCKQIQQPRQIAAGDHVLRHLLPAARRQGCDQPLRSA
jgi:hypothetical protein